MLRCLYRHQGQLYFYLYITTFIPGSHGDRDLGIIALVSYIILLLMYTLTVKH
jgi:hypothetical protein